MFEPTSNTSPTVHELRVERRHLLAAAPFPSIEDAQIEIPEGSVEHSVIRQLFGEVPDFHSSTRTLNPARGSMVVHDDLLGLLRRPYR
jgi:hypothetical protein